MPLTSEDPKKATKDYNDTLTGGPDGIASTDVIVYVAVGVSALIVCAFLYVCVRRLRKKAPSSSYTLTPTPSPTEAALTAAPRLVASWTVPNGVPKPPSPQTDATITEDPPPPPSPSPPTETADGEGPKEEEEESPTGEVPCPTGDLEMVTWSS